jgi:hypothetical protein
MIQRKQSIFLLLAAIALVFCFAFPIATFNAKAPLGVPVSGALHLIPKDNPEMMNEILNGQPVTMGQKGFIKTWPLMVLTLATIAIALVSIFFYKNRPTQMKVVAVGFLLTVVDIFLIFIWAVDKYIKAVTTPMACTDIHTHYAVGAFLPIVAAILFFLAQRSIKADEEKVRAADRLR